ncbi:hypothetical protein AAVH_35686, partial [Aphelenchoides avenae]
MAVHLSRLAKHYIADFVNHREVIMMPREWHEMYEVFSSGGVQRHRMPPPEYAMTNEFDICFRKDVTPDALEYLFTEGPEAMFWFKVPTGLFSTIVESFLQQSSETALRPIFCVCDSPGPTLLWQELYVDFFPCVRCQRTQLGEEQLPGRERPYRFHDPTLPEHIRHHNTVGWYESTQEHLQRTPTYIIEAFHVKNTTTGQAISIELWFDSFSPEFLERLGSFPANGRVQKRELRRVKIYAGGCGHPVPMPLLSATPSRTQLIAELMLEAYRFLDRYSLDVGQLVCDEWR